MIQIRQGVFETNSSSSHSIVMMKKDHPTETIEDSNMIDGDWHVDEKGVMDFDMYDNLDFGRTPFDLLADWWGRLRYCIAYYGNDENKLQELEEICKRRIAGFTSFQFHKDRFGQEYHGYVDHQSYGVLPEALKRFNITLEELIFNDRYIIVIDGDEYCVFNTLVNSDMFSKDNVENIVSENECIDTDDNWSEE